MRLGVSLAGFAAAAETANVADRAVEPGSQAGLLGLDSVWLAGRTSCPQQRRPDASGTPTPGRHADHGDQVTARLADQLHNMRTVQFIPQAKQLRKARESLNIFVPVAAQLSMDRIEAELETLAHATMKRNRHARSASGCLLVAVAALLPGATRTRWCEEWLGEHNALPTQRDRAGFAIHTMLGIPRLAFTIRLPARGHRQSG